jgi:hypothetical protein
MNPAIEFPKIVSRIIKEQENLIGPLAWDEARKVEGLTIVDEKKGEITLGNGDPKTMIDMLVAQYERIFGKASHLVCHDAVKDILAGMQADEIPNSLK